jgi:hypothetical protein
MKPIDKVKKYGAFFIFVAGELFLLYAFFSTFQLPFPLLERKLDVLPNAFIYLILALLLACF